MSYCSICEFRAACPRLLIFLLCCRILLIAQAPVPPNQAPVTERERALLDRVARLEQRMAVLESKLSAQSAEQTAPSSDPSSISTDTTQAGATKNTPAIGFLPGTTMNLYFDGHYGWNFNQPIGRVNLL